MSPTDFLWFVTLPLSVFFALVLAGIATRPARGFLVLAAVTLVAGFAGDARAWLLQHELSTWQPLPGHVLVSEKGQERGEWRFQYGYEAAGAARTGSRYTYSPHFNSRQGTEELIEEYPVGRQITVYVDPTDPERSSVYATPRYTLPLAALAIHAWLGAALARSLRRP